MRHAQKHFQPAAIHATLGTRKHNTTNTNRGNIMTKLQQLINLIDGLDNNGPDYLQVREAKQLAHELEAGK